MADTTYQRALVDAQIIAPGRAGSGITPWREEGLKVAQLMADAFTAKVDEFAPVARTEHPFLGRQDEYQRVFPTYRNVYQLPDGDGDRVLRADNLHLNVAWLRASGHAGPVVATSGLLRRMRGGGAPLFRDRYIWPAVQLSHEVPAGAGEETLRGYQGVLERTFAAFGLPVLTIAVEAPAGYGDKCHLTISCLRDGRPTVLATTYLMARPYREALRVRGELVDVGFTGKVLALAAMHHRDSWGLGLPSALSPVQVGVLAAPGGARRLDRWHQALDGVRARVVTVPSESGYRRHRAERTLLRAGVPLTYGVRGDGGWRMTVRAPLARGPAPSPPGPDHVRDELDRHDRRLLLAAAGRLARGIDGAGLVSGACDTCAATGRVPALGHLVPERASRCTGCGGPGRASFISTHGRFY